MTPDHIGLALTRSPSPAHGVLAAVGVDPVDWRDEIVKVLGWREGANAERSGRPAGSLSDSLAERRFEGAVVIDGAAAHIVELSEQEAAANNEEVAPVHLVVALLVEGWSVAAASGGWLGMSPGRVRSAAGLRNVRRVIAGGAPPGRIGGPPAPGAGPVVLCGGDSRAVLPDAVAAGTRGGTPEAVVVDLTWRTMRPTAEERQRQVDALVDAGARAVDSGMVERADAGSPEACERLGAADLLWFPGGDVAALYDRLWATPALDAIVHAHRNGAVLAGVSAGAAVWGAGTLSDFGSLGEEEPFPLFGLLDSLVVFPHFAPTRERRFRQMVTAFPGCRGLAVAHGGSVLIPAGGGEPQVLREGRTGPHMLLDNPGAPLATLE